MISLHFLAFEKPDNARWFNKVESYNIKIIQKNEILGKYYLLVRKMLW